MYQFLHSTEFYVILFTLAALLVGLLARPADRGVAETSFAVGELYEAAGESVPAVEISCRPDGSVELRRYGLSGLTDSATVALAITRVGFDISVEERVTPGLASGAAVNCAVFRIDGLANERYHVKYNSQPYSTFVSFSFHNRPGLNITREFPS